jgi:molybdopterin molybdotransferase
VPPPRVYRKLRVGVIVTGDELATPLEAPEPWRIRDCNGPFVQSLLSGCSRVRLDSLKHVRDEPSALARQLNLLLDGCDAVIITGGVSKGDYDHVPAVVAGTGAEVLFHGLPIRPGHPILGAVTRQNQAIIGLPGNPLAVMVGMCRVAAAALARLSGMQSAAMPRVQLADTISKPLQLWWYRPVRIEADGRARLVSSKGSGDIPSAVRSDGFIELEPGAAGSGSWPFYRWELA